MPKVHPHDPPRPDICRICFLLREPGPRGDAMRLRYRPQEPCPHRGPPTGLEVSCPDCGRGRVQVPILACALHGTCTAERLVSRTACCKICPDRPAVPAGDGEEGP